jgi:hypothetical protein
MPEPDYVLLSLIIAVIIIAVLLLVCWKNKNENQSYGRSKPRNYHMKNNRMAPLIHSDYDVNTESVPVSRQGDTGQMGKSLASGGYSYFGTAQNNRDYNNRSDNVVMDMKGYGDYNDVTRYMGLEKNVYDSHNQWIQDMNHTTSGASMQSERDDLGDLPVSWVLRKPNYTDHPGIEASARQDVSFSKDQMPVYRHYQL